MLAAGITRSAVCSLSFFISYGALAQKDVIPKYEAGINAGIYLYQGDLTPHHIGSIETIQPGIGIFGTRIINTSFSVRLMFITASLAADESIYKYPAWRQQRNFSFAASVKELGLSLHWNISGTNYYDVKYEPYVFAGAAVSVINTNSNYSRVNWAYFGETSELGDGLAVDVARPSQKIIPAVPIGAGVRYHLSKKIVLNLESCYRLMHSDYVDGFSKSANPGLSDHYLSITMGAAYKFGNKEKYGCPAQLTMRN
jgi:OOP family OmpA-OmpF porin